MHFNGNDLYSFMCKYGHVIMVWCVCSHLNYLTSHTNVPFIVYSPFDVSAQGLWEYIVQLEKCAQIYTPEIRIP